MRRARRRGITALDVALGAVAGAVGTTAMSFVTRWLYENEDRRARRREDAVRDDFPTEVLGARLVDATSLEVTERRKKRVGAVVHWGYGIAWGAIYAAARRRWPALRLALGLPFGLAFFVLSDELITVVMGLAAPPREYPVQTHARGLAGHLAYVAAAEATCRAAERIAT